MAIDKKSREYEVCPCRHVTRGQVEDYVRETRVNDLKALCEGLNVGNKCGGCREMLMQIMDEILTEE